MERHGGDPNNRFVGMRGSIDLPKGSTELDEQARRQVREHLIRAIKNQHPDLSPEVVLEMVDQQLPQIIGQLNFDLTMAGGFYEEGVSNVTSSAVVEREDPTD